MNEAFVRLVECPRDSWQGLAWTVPTADKAAHLRALLAGGFRFLDCASFVSAAAVPQMADSEAVLAELDPPAGTDLLAIVANARGLERALEVPRVTSVGYPLSVSDTFQRRNTRRSLDASWPLVEELARGAGRLRLVVYLSMGFGNPYGDPWDESITLDAVSRLRDLGVREVALADTLGRADARLVRALCAAAVARFGADALGVHLHARPEAARAVARAALDAGIRWIEGALGGVGGCPFADDELVGNLPTEAVLEALYELGLTTGVDRAAVPRLASNARRLAAGPPDRREPGR